MKDIASQLAKKKNIRISEAENYLDAFFAVIHDGLKADKLVKIKGFGTFKLIEVRDRESVDVNTGERVLIDGHTKITFTPENSLKEMVNKPFSQFETVELNDGVEFGSMPNENVEALRVFMLSKKVECRPVWKPMHKQPVYKNNPAYINGVSASLFKIGFCLPAGPYVSDEDVKYIVDCIKEAIVK